MHKLVDSVVLNMDLTGQNNNPMKFSPQPGQIVMSFELNTCGYFDLPVKIQFKTELNKKPLEFELKFQQNWMNFTVKT